MLNRKRIDDRGAYTTPDRVKRSGLRSPDGDVVGWEEQEEAVARAVPDGRRTRGSGCSTRSSRKGDVVSPLWRVEAKTTSSRALRVKRDDLEKIRSEARKEGQHPALVFGFDVGDDRGREDWMAFPLPVARILMSIASGLLSQDDREAYELAELLRGVGDGC